MQEPTSTHCPLIATHRPVSVVCAQHYANVSTHTKKMQKRKKGGACNASAGRLREGTLRGCQPSQLMSNGFSERLSKKNVEREKDAPKTGVLF